MAQSLNDSIFFAAKPDASKLACLPCFVVCKGLVDEGVQFAGFAVRLNLFVPGARIKLGKPSPEFREILLRKALNSPLDCSTSLTSSLLWHSTDTPLYLIPAETVRRSALRARHFFNHDPPVVLAPMLKSDLEPRHGRARAQQLLAPLHDNGSVLGKQFVETERSKLTRAFHPVKIEVIDLLDTAVLMNQRERRAVDLAFGRRSQARSDPLGKYRFAAAEFAFQQDEAGRRE